MADTTTKQPFTFPDFNMPGFPFANLPAQLAASFVPPDQQFTNASQYGRWNGVNNNAFGLFPNQFQGLFGFQPGGQMPFQPPYANNGNLGSNQGPGSNPGTQPPPTQPPSSPPTGVSGQPALPPGQSPFTPGLPAVPPAGYGGGMQPPYVPPMTPGNVPPAGYGGGQMNSVVPPSPATPPMNPMPSGTSGQSAYAGQNKSAVAADTVGGLLSGPMQTNAVTNGPYAGQLQRALSYGDGRSKFAQAMLNQSGPRNVSTTQFNQVAAQNPRLAETLLGMTPGLSNAVMQQNGLSPQQMNQFINGTFYGAGDPRAGALNQQNLAFLNSLGIR